MKKLGTRLGLNFGAQIYSQGVTIVVQLGLIPTLLHAWGTERYGVWLMLAAIPMYLTFSDFGFTFIAKNEMMMAVARADRKAAVSVFQSVFTLLSIVTPILLALAVGTILSVNVDRVLNLGEVPESTARFVLLALIVDVLLYQQLLLLCGAIRCTCSAALESALLATSRLAEGIAIGSVALAGGGLRLAAVMVLVNRCLFVALFHCLVRRRAPWLTLGFTHATRSEVSRMLKPSVAFMLVPVSQALAIQGPTLIVGSVIGPIAAVIYSSSRTLARMGTSGINMLSFAFAPEYAEVWGRSDLAGFWRLVRLQMILTAFGIVGYVAIIVPFSHPLLGLLTSHNVDIVEPFFAVLVVSVAAEMAWTAAFVPLSGTNQHTRASIGLFALSCIAITAAYGATYYFGLVGSAGSLAALHFAMLLLTATSLGALRVPSAALTTRSTEET